MASKHPPSDTLQLTLSLYLSVCHSVSLSYSCAPCVLEELNIVPPWWRWRHVRSFPRTLPLTKRPNRMVDRVDIVEPPARWIVAQCKSG
uniref:Putative secreted protein n=1 Tax=Anopheles darlingi TaxID=43151 RepID=A0A2M4DJS0_ANODA